MATQFYFRPKLFSLARRSQTISVYDFSSELETNFHIYTKGQVTVFYEIQSLRYRMEIER
jgi:hypothetical protein